MKCKCSSQSKETLRKTSLALVETFNENTSNSKRPTKRLRGKWYILFLKLIVRWSRNKIDLVPARDSNKNKTSTINSASSTIKTGDNNSSSFEYKMSQTAQHFKRL